MGHIGRIYVELRNRVSRQGDGMPDFGVKECPFCNGKGCDECMHMGSIARTADDDENDYIDEMERRGDAERDERINN